MTFEASAIVEHESANDEWGLVLAALSGPRAERAAAKQALQVEYGWTEHDFQQANYEVRAQQRRARSSTSSD
jgi:hypothetical protein